MTFYHNAAIIALNVENGEGLRSQLYSKNLVDSKKDLPKVSFLVNNALQKKKELDELILKSGLKEELRNKDLWLARILVTELVLGRKSYRPECPVMKTVYKKKSKLRETAKAMKVTKKTEINNPRYVRVDTNNVTLSEVHEYLSGTGRYKLVECAAKELPTNAYVIDAHVPALLVFHPKAPVHELDWVTSGNLILQDKSSCLVAHLLAPHPCSTVLDMCAAPGFKTQHVASLTHGLGRIIAVDKNVERYKALCQLKDKFSLSNLTCVHSDVLNTENLGRYKGSVEYILLDPPCSGSGMAKNYDFDPTEKRDGERYQKLRNLQAKMLRSALTDYPAARRITYSTCSVSEEENESVIEEFYKMKDVPGGFTLVDLSPFYPGLSRGRSNYKCGSKCIRLSPETDGTNGFFIAMFERINPPALPVSWDSSAKSLKRTADDNTTTNMLKKKQRVEPEVELSKLGSESEESSDEGVPNLDNSVESDKAVEASEDSDDEDEESNGGSEVGEEIGVSPNGDASGSSSEGDSEQDVEEGELEDDDKLRGKEEDAESSEDGSSEDEFEDEPETENQEDLSAQQFGRPREFWSRGHGRFGSRSRGNDTRGGFRGRGDSRNRGRGGYENRGRGGYENRGRGGFGNRGRGGYENRGRGGFGNRGRGGFGNRGQGGSGNRGRGSYGNRGRGGGDRGFRGGRGRFAGGRRPSRRGNSSP